mmetsp:Transcript_104529/g.248771  ORF Transcript_104529/g.248771 Transcript_104529/m.248771 type:complete len:214 (-) Transcript_104529:314-955(-)
MSETPVRDETRSAPEHPALHQVQVGGCPSARDAPRTTCRPGSGIADSRCCRNTQCHRRNRADTPHPGSSPALALLQSPDPANTVAGRHLAPPWCGAPGIPAALALRGSLARLRRCQDFQAPPASVAPQAQVRRYGRHPRPRGRSRDLFPCGGHSRGGFRDPGQHSERGARSAWHPPLLASIPECDMFPRSGCKCRECSCRSLLPASFVQASHQ